MDQHTGRAVVNRRRFLAGLVAGTGALATLACGSPAAAPAPPAAPPASAPPAASPAGGLPPAPTPAPAAAASPAAAAPAAPAARSGPAVALRFPLSSDTPTFEPGLINSLIPARLAKQMHAGLFALDEQSKLAPYIARSWETSTDAKEFTIKIRDDVTFHNGRKLVAQDFKDTWTRHLTPGVKAQISDYLKAIVGGQDILDGKSDQLTGVEVPDPTTIKIKLVAPDPEFLNYLGYGVVAKETVQAGKPEWVDKPVGAGPFKFAEWQRNSKIVLEAHDTFFLGKPKVDRLELLIVADSATARAQFEAGELDAAEVLGPDMPPVRADPVLSKQLQTWPNAQLNYLGFNQKVFEPFRKLQVRQAFIHAIDAKALAEQVLQGASEQAIGLVPKGIYSFNPNVKGYQFDPAKARQLLAEAGYPDGNGFPELTLQGGQTNQTLCEAAAAQLTANLKIPVKLEITERAEFVKRMFARNTLQLYIWGWTASYNSPAQWLYELIHSKSPTNFVNYENPAYDKIVDEARVTVDEAKRVALYQQAEQLALDEAVLGPIAFARYNYLVKPAVGGLRFDISGPGPFNSVETRR